jgi:hypothetical protein
MLEAMMLDAKDAILQYRAALARLQVTALVAPYVVQCEGGPVTFDMGELGLITNVRPCRPHLARSSRGSRLPGCFDRAEWQWGLLPAHSPAGRAGASIGCAARCSAAADGYSVRAVRRCIVMMLA